MLYSFSSSLGLLLVLALGCGPKTPEEGSVKVTRLDGNPIITPEMDERMGSNINGPSLIRVPDWIVAPLGRYYLYFSHHKGKYIRLAYADRVEGPWTVHSPGTLTLEDSAFPTEPPGQGSLSADGARRQAFAEAGGLDTFFYAHIASPEVVVVPEKREIRLYYHGLLETGAQGTRVAVSRNGLQFEALPDVITGPYLRVFGWDGQTYDMAMPGVFYRSRYGLTDFEKGPSLFNPAMRHAALLVRGHTLYVFWTQAGHEPERILLSTIDLSGDWSTWQASAPIDVLRPEKDWEGASLPLEPSRRGAALEPVHELRDPAIFEEHDRLWLLYSVAGEHGIGLARLELDID